jgi:hypothetical protein
MPYHRRPRCGTPGHTTMKLRVGFGKRPIGTLISPATVAVKA